MKGNVIVGQSGGPTAVINSSLAGVFKTAKDRGAKKIYGMLNGIKGLLDEKYIDLTEKLDSTMAIDLLKRTPSSALGSCRFKLPDVEKDPETYKKIFEVLNKLEIKYFFYIGGNDSMDTIQKLCAYGKSVNSDISFMGVPKTIDNDLAITDHTPGFGSAAKFIASTMKEIIRDGHVYDYPTISIVEIMGRNAGWLTASAALAKSDDCEGVDLIYLPEKVFDVDHFLNKIKELSKTGKSIVVAVSEGVKVADGRFVFELAAEHVEFVDAFGHKQMSGTATFLANKVTAELGTKARAIELSTLQRCAAHMASRTDITEAYNVGGAAVKAAFEGESGKVVVIKRVSDDPYMAITETADVEKIANIEKKIPLEWITDDDYVTQDLIHYIHPLIQAELSPIMVDGLPRHLNLSMQ
ncbi:6-phosphofructokinase [uncultured Treponema sp.]|uniref:6-phosphofructokinase n=1 Tax=uncultured Treponema sp. TaxID=162155 RepID=UPI0025EE8FA1|nr:6-phosphofructokinase [uncultured Treponema sp.]